MSRVKADYFQWLIEMVEPNQGDKSWLILLHTLFNEPFYAVVKRDVNRCADGCALREEFQLCTNHPDYNEIYEGPCNMLELLVSLARSMDFELGGVYSSYDHTDLYFWELIKNLKLDCYDDQHFDRRAVHHILLTWVSREYDSDGSGGIFPLYYPKQDQRYVELWEQLTYYLQERYPNY